RRRRRARRIALDAVWPARLGELSVGAQAALSRGRICLVAGGRLGAVARCLSARGRALAAGPFAGLRGAGQADAVDRVEQGLVVLGVDAGVGEGLLREREQRLVPLRQ